VAIRRPDFRECENAEDGRIGQCDAVLTDTRLMELVREHRRDEAIGLLLPAFRRKVFGLAYSFLRDREAAEDVTQEVFIKVWRALPGFDGRASISTWIYTIARNASLSALRARRSQSSLSDPEVMEAVEASNPVPAADVIADRAAILRLVDQLPAKQRQVIMLFYMEAQSHEEVAAMLAMPVGTVKTLLHRARTRLSAAVATKSVTA
jgi:RNA polymerase sigma-70 factor (ECF subfamily)